MRSRIWAHKNQSGGYSAGVACYHVSGLGKVAFKVFVFLFWSGGGFLWGWGQGLSEVEFLLKQTLERQRAEIKQLHLEKASFTLLRYLQKGLQSVSVWYVCNVFTDSIMVFFYSITQLSCAARENWQQSSRPPQRRASSSSRYQTAY